MNSKLSSKKIWSYLLDSFVFIFIFSFSVYAFDGVIVSIEGGTIIQADFTDLNDTPANYTGFADFCVIVNGSETGVKFGNCSTASGSGDITAVNTDGIYLSGGAVTGAVSLLFNDTTNNATILSLIGLDEFHYNQTTASGSGGFTTDQNDELNSTGNPRLELLILQTKLELLDYL